MPIRDENKTTHLLSFFFKISDEKAVTRTVMVPKGTSGTGGIWPGCGSKKSPEMHLVAAYDMTSYN